MKQLLIKMLVLLTILSSCKKNITTSTIVPSVPGSMTVKSSSTYAVSVDYDVKYGEGLSHQSLNSSSYTVMDLKLDVYKPVNDTNKKPAILFIHGGGFTGGDKSDTNIVHLTNYFASRGWIAFSINYRVRGDNGTVPTAWIQYAQTNLVPDSQAQLYALYPAHRDAKAAVRWIIANANQYNIDTNYITVGGGSAGSIMAVTLGITNTTDYTNEISITEDPSLATTNLNSNNYTIKTILDFWGSALGVNAIDTIYGYNRFDPTDAPIMIAHGTLDQTVPYSNALELKNIYTSTGANYVFYPLENRGHAAWDATVNGKSLDELSFDFIVQQQHIIVE